MEIEEVVKLWQNSKYNNLWLISTPMIKHNKEICWSTGIYEKGQTILCGGEYKVEDYLLKIYKDSLWLFEKYDDNSLHFKMIIRDINKLFDNIIRKEKIR